MVGVQTTIFLLYIYTYVIQCSKGPYMHALVCKGWGCAVHTCASVCVCVCVCVCVYTLTTIKHNMLYACTLVCVYVRM